MSISITIPRLEMAMEEGGLAQWLVEDGAEVKEGDPLYVLETDKAAQEVASPASGKLVHKAAAGHIYPVETLIGEIV